MFQNLEIISARNLDTVHSCGLNGATRFCPGHQWQRVRVAEHIRAPLSVAFSPPISSVFGRVVPEWLNYHLLKDFSFFWSQTFMGGNMTRLRCAPPKDNRFLSFLHSQRGRVVGLWVHYEPQQALSVLRGGGGNGSNSAVPNPPAFY